jgi:hypothetical protein
MNGIIPDDVAGLFLESPGTLANDFFKNPVTSANFFFKVLQPCPAFYGKAGKSLFVF